MSSWLIGVAALVVSLAAWGQSTDEGRHAGASPQRLEPVATVKARVETALGTLPLYFIENRGQADRRVSYYLQGGDASLYFTRQGVTLALAGDSRGAALDGARSVVRQEFVGANRGVTPTGNQLTPTRVSYFKGPRSEWKTGLPTYGEVIYRDLWPGIDLVYSGTSSKLKYTFVVQPGADPRQIRLAYRGATAISVNRSGQLDVTTPVRSFREDRPYAYQVVKGQRVTVPMAYAIEPHPAAGTHTYGFRVGGYDAGRPLVLDPVMLVYAGYVGGSADDRGNGIAVDSGGNAYIAGITSSSEETFPVNVGPDLTSNFCCAGDFDAFVVKVNAAGTGLVYAGYIGGSAGDLAEDIAVDAAGNAYVTGITGSDQTTFPVTVGPDLTFDGGAPRGEAFVAKVNASGTGLTYAGYIDAAEGWGIAVDAIGNAYVSGVAWAAFPATVGPDLTFNGGNSDAFVAKVNAAGTGLVYAGFIGGNAPPDSPEYGGVEGAADVAVDGAGDAYVVGGTDSTEADGFPATVGPDVTHNGGWTDGWVAKVSADGSALVYAGYIGGSNQDSAGGVAVDGAGNAYITGATMSSDLPVTVGPDLTHNGGDPAVDAYVAKVSATGTGFVYLGYIGGAAPDEGHDIAVDGAGNAYVTGMTLSSEGSFPNGDGFGMLPGPDTTFNGGYDAFVAKVDAAGTALDYAGYIGGAPISPPSPRRRDGNDSGNGIAVDGAGNAYVVGDTTSTEVTFPDGDGFGTLTGPDTTFNGGYDAFVAKIGSPPPASVPLYLHGSGGTANPPTLTLDSTAPGSTTVKYRDSSSVSFSGGNPWKAVGTWTAAPAGSAQTLSALGDLRVFLGLKNSDDQGTQFDLRAEVLKDGVLVGSSTTLCLTGVTRNPSLAKEVAGTFGPLAVTSVAAGDVLSLNLSTRIGTNPDGSKCSGPGGSHSNAVGLRVYFDAVGRPAQFSVTLGP